MALRISCYLFIFWVMQVIAQLIFKWGSGGDDSHWLWGFIAGNLFGFSSIWLLMLLYKAINPNIALGIATGGAFLLSQVALAIVFKSKLGLIQSAGIAAMVIGMIALAMGRPAYAGDGTRQVTAPERAEPTVSRPSAPGRWKKENYK